jgi:hypothetical protein
MSLSTASILLLLLLHACSLLAAARVPDPVEHGDVNTAMLTNGSASATPSSPDSSSNGNFDMYLCFLCSGRDPLLIHHCPIYWDECHLICDDDMSTATPTPPAVAVSSSSSSRPVPMVQVQGDDDCYVMKLYMSGRYVIVEHRPCKYIAWCFLTCGGGELAAADRKAVTATAIQGTSLPAELCGTQAVNAPPLAGVVVPAAAAAAGGAGAHRRR